MPTAQFVLQAVMVASIGAIEADAEAAGNSIHAGIQGTYTDWLQPSWPVEGFSTIEGTILPLNDPVPAVGQVDSSYFYAMQFHFFDGLGAYIGIQIRPGAEWGRLAIFSVWQATAATCADVPGAICQPFEGEGEGYQTLIPYNWIAGHTYRTRVRSVGTDESGDWWAGEIIDLNTQTTQLIGRIRVPLSYRRLTYYQINWVEWFGPDPGNCDAIPQSIVQFSPPIGSPGAVAAGAPDNHLGNPAYCPSSLSTRLDGSVVHYNGRDRIFVNGFDP